MTATLPFDLEAAGPWGLALGIILATFVSEDLTCVAVGLLIAAGKVDWPLALAACVVGIAVGDLGVWLIGRTAAAGGRRWGWVRRRLPAAAVEGWADALCRRAGRAVLVSRFVPGSRVPLFLAAGVLGTCPYRVLGWAFVAAGVWVLVVVALVVWTGTTFQGLGWVVLPLVGLGGLVGLKAGPRLFSGNGRAKLVAAVSKVWRWEFWPAWVFYLPLVPWVLILSARYRSLTVWTAANPGITPAGGVVGESKADILAKLAPERVLPIILIPPGDHTERVRLALDGVAGRGWGYPLVLKPDAGQRGAGVRKVRDAAGVEEYLRANPAAVLAQLFDPGPFEAGVFYYRLPGEERGHIFSVTEKVFPVVVGDGQSTLEELIWAHLRYRMQAGTFLTRHAAEVGRVPGAGERFPLAMAGNHCQGTLFRDGGHLATPELVAAFDRIVGPFDGFYVGRFDVRYADPAEFRAGRGFAVLELNGVTSESTNLYDPSWPLWRAYRTLFRQWALLFRIGAANRDRGHRPVTPGQLLALVLTHYRGRTTSAGSD